jgi:hypothetical protein
LGCCETSSTSVARPCTSCCRTRRLITQTAQTAVCNQLSFPGPAAVPLAAEPGRCRAGLICGDDGFRNLVRRSVTGTGFCEAV